MKKRFLSILLAAIMALAPLPTAALAAEDGFVMEDGVLTKYNGPGGDVTIPSGVTIIGDVAFYGCTGLTSVTIPDSVTSIGWEAFSGCTGLTGVTIGSGVTRIEARAFYGCTSLTSVTIPAGVTGIGEYAYSETPWLEGLGEFAVVNGILLAYHGEGGAVAIPDNVTCIGDHAFEGCGGLTAVTIPDCVTSIGSFAFSHCTGLTSVAIGRGVTSIGQRAFMDCPGLTSVVLPSGVTEIEDGAFSYCGGLTAVTIPASVTGIGRDVINGSTNLKDVYYGGTEEQWKASWSWFYKFPFCYEAFDLVTIHYNRAGPEQSQSLPANPTNDKLTVDGKPAAPTAYKIDNTNYLKLRDVAALLDSSPKQFSVDYDDAAKAVTITTGQAYQRLGTELAGVTTSNQTAAVSNNEVYINGVKTGLTGYKINGENYFRIRDLAEKLGFNAGWTEEDGMFIESSKPYDPAN